MILLLAAALMAPQDLFEKAKQAPPIKIQTGRERLDLSMGPFLDPERCTIKPGKVGVDLKISPDFACGTFDVAAGFKSVFNKNLREELLGALIQEARAELAGSAMVLACQMSPTVCDAMKHYKVLSSDALTMQFEQCRAVEAASAGLNESLRARAIKQCLAELQAKGVPLDDAMKQCQKSEELRGLSGDKVKEIDLVKEIGQSLGLSIESKNLLAELAGGLKLGSRGVNGELKVRPVGQTFDKLRGGFEKNWTQAVDEAARGVLKPDSLTSLVPKAAPPVTPAEVQRLALMDEVDRRVVIGSLAATMALQETARHLTEVESAIESADALAQDPAMQAALHKEASRLSSEFRRLREEYELSDLVSIARLRADGKARDAASHAFQRSTDSWRREARNDDVAKAAAPWGSGCPVDKKKAP